MRAEDLVLGVARTPAFDMALDVLERVGPWHRDYLPVLTYHRIDEPAASPLRYPGLISATPAGLDRQLAFVAAEMQPITMEQLLAATTGVGQLPRRAILVTFDDASADFGRHAWPILRRHRIPATLFVPTAFPGDPTRRFWWDDLYGALQSTDRPQVDDLAGATIDLRAADTRRSGYRVLVDRLKAMDHELAMERVEALLGALGYVPDAHRPTLDWDELRGFARDGLELAAHTRRHPLLTRVDAMVAMEELTGSREDLEREVGPVLPVFAYPSGAWSEDAASLVATAGFELAFTTDRGINHVPTAPRMALKRINVGHRASRGVLRAQLLPLLRAMPGWVRQAG